MKFISLMLAFLALSVGVVTAASSLPDGARGFAGMVGGKVLAKGAGQITIEVTAIVKSWKHSRAEKPEALVGQKVAVMVKPGLYERKPGYLARVQAFFDGLKAGDSATFDVKDGEDGSLTFLELAEGGNAQVAAGEKKRE